MFSFISFGIGRLNILDRLKVRVRRLSIFKFLFFNEEHTQAKIIKLTEQNKNSIGIIIVLKFSNLFNTNCIIEFELLVQNIWQNGQQIIHQLDVLNVGFSLREIILNPNDV